MRTIYIDPDCRREPRTDRYCVRCQKDIKPGQPTRMIHLEDGVMAIHPEEEPVTPEKDSGWWLVGMDCARKIGLEWTHETDEARL